jgi:hypothetical protein
MKKGMVSLLPLGAFGTLLGYRAADPVPASAMWCFDYNGVASDCSACLVSISPPRIGYYQCDDAGPWCVLWDRACGWDGSGCTTASTTGSGSGY